MSDTTIPTTCDTAPCWALSYHWSTPTEVVHVLEKDIRDLEKASHGAIRRVETAAENVVHEVEAEVKKVEAEVKKVVGGRAKKATAAKDDLSDALEASSVNTPKTTKTGE